MGCLKKLHTENFQGNLTPKPRSRVKLTHPIQETFDWEVGP